MREDTQHFPYPGRICLRTVHFRGLGAEEEQPYQRGNRAKPDVWHAHPEQFAAHDSGKLVLRHGKALLRCRRIEVREDELLGEDYSGERADGVEHLGEV